ncbi:hypothetical protein L9F63_014109, partial [Diploptera punctata]
SEELIVGMRLSTILITLNFPLKQSRHNYGKPGQPPQRPPNATRRKQIAWVLGVAYPHNVFSDCKVHLCRFWLELIEEFYSYADIHIYTYAMYIQSVIHGHLLRSGVNKNQVTCQPASLL